MPQWFADEKELFQNATYLQVLEKGGASLSTKEISNCYASTGFALFYAQSGRMDQSSVIAFLPFFING